MGYKINGVELGSFIELKRWIKLYLMCGTCSFTVEVKKRKFHFSRRVAHELRLTDAIAAPEYVVDGINVD